MRKHILFLMPTIVLGLAACTPSAVQQSGGSGMDDSSYAWTAPRTSHGCLADDTNCREFYDSPGGG
jgi:hypothetical protein